MKILVSEKLSEHKYKTPEGYLICTDAILARTGKQTYTKDEVFGDGDNTEIDIDRPYEQVMNEKTIASFENKPVTFDHPEEDVNVGNYKDYAIGYVRDVHQGKVNGQDVILGNLVITDQDAIDVVESGEHTDLSCGYDCDIKDSGDGNYFQSNIRGNHVALCKEGRAGMARIVDSRVDNENTKIINDAFNNGKLKDFRIEDLIRLVKERSEAVNSIRLGNDGNTYFITVGGFLNMDLNTGRGAYLDVVYENKDSHLQKRCLMIPQASSWNEIITAFNNWKNTLRNINDSKIQDDNRLVRMSKSIESREFSSYFQISYVDKNGRLIARPDVFYNKADYDAIIAYAKKIGKPIIYFTYSPYIGDSKVEDSMYTYKLAKKKNDYDEYTIRAYKNGKYDEAATYYTDDWQDALDTLKMMAKREGLSFRQQGSIYVADSKFEDMAVWQLKPETNLDKLSVAITNKDIESLKAMLGIINKDIDDYNKNFNRLSASDKLMLKKRFGKLVDKMNKLGVKTHQLKTDSIGDSKSKGMTLKDTMKILSIIRKISK